MVSEVIGQRVKWIDAMTGVALEGKFVGHSYWGSCLVATPRGTIYKVRHRDLTWLHMNNP